MVAQAKQEDMRFIAQDSLISMNRAFIMYNIIVNSLNKGKLYQRTGKQENL